MKNKKVLVLGVVFGFLVLGIIGYLRFFQTDFTSESISNADYQKAKEKIEKIIIESDYYNQVSGHDLEYESKDSDHGQLSCVDCDGFKHYFYTRDGNKIYVMSGFSKIPSRSISIDYVEAVNPGNRNVSYDLLNNQEDPLDQPVGPEQSL